MKTPPANPVQRYRQAMKDCDTYLNEIRTQLDVLTNPGTITWTSVGDANRLRAELAAIADRLMERGEYAPENRG